MKFTNERLISYSKPLSETEENKCKNAIQMVSNAMKNKGYREDSQGINLSVSGTYAYETRLRKNGIEIKLLVQGSYANKTNVKADSDVDIAIIQENIFNVRYRQGVTDENYNFTSATYPFDQYKKDIYKKLTAYFGMGKVEWNNKCLSVDGTSYHTDLDAVPARRNRDYTNDYKMDNQNYLSGIRIIPDKGESIVNYPEQHIKNGRDKNNATNRNFKKNVRIMKKLRYLMKDEGFISANKVSSFMLESLLWNIPNHVFLADVDYISKFQMILNYAKNYSDLGTYKEANGIKPLCSNEEAKLNLKRFIIDLDRFYEPWQ